MNMSMIKCKECGKQPHEIEEYVANSIVEYMTPAQFVQQEEGTYNHKTGLFYCTRCYIKVGMPLGTA